MIDKNNCKFCGAMMQIMLMLWKKSIEKRKIYLTQLPL
jgi:hypothetical protein